MQEGLKREFERLVNQIHKDTRFSSNMQTTFLHPDYQKIIGMGKVALPLIFENMKYNNPHVFWYHALRQITNEDPVDKKLWGNVRAMDDCWLKWWQEKNNP